MSRGVLLIDKKEVPIIQVGVKTRVRKVTAADHFVIPAQSECIIDEQKDTSIMISLVRDILLLSRTNTFRQNIHFKWHQP